MWSVILILGVIFFVSFMTNALINHIPKHGLSKPAKKIYDEFMALPEANRPAVEIRTVLRALDIKHGKDKATRHFYEHNYGFKWDGHCGSVHRQHGDGGCRFKDYFGLHASIEEVTKELADQEHRIAVSHVADGIDNAHSLVEILKREREYISDATKMIIGE